MSKIKEKEKEMNSNIKDNPKNKKSLQLSYSHLDKNNLKEKFYEDYIDKSRWGGV